MQIQRKSNGSAALRIAGRLIFSSAFLLTVGGIAALVVSLQQGRSRGGETQAPGQARRTQAAEQ